LQLHAENQTLEPEKMLETVSSSADILALQGVVNTIKVSEAVIAYINKLVRATRQRRDIYLGASPRGGIALLKTARVLAASEGRDYVVPDDVKQLVLPAFRHRVVLTPEAEVEGKSADDVIREIIESVEVPRS
jgi:MoxR-like ATPase